MLLPARTRTDLIVSAHAPSMSDMHTGYRHQDTPAMTSSAPTDDFMRKGRRATPKNWAAPTTIDHTKVTTMPALDSSQLRAMRASSSDASAMPMSPSTEARGWPTEANACTSTIEDPRNTRAIGAKTIANNPERRRAERFRCCKSVMPLV